MKKLLLIIALFCFTVNNFAQQQSLPKVEINGTEYYEYTIEAGDGLYSISKRFGVNQSELHNANKDLTTNIKAGQKILIPIKKEINSTLKTNGKNRIHVVEAKQTLYSISKLYSVKLDSLIKLNPGCEKGIQIGQNLLIPNNSNNIIQSNEKKDSVIKHFVKRKETLYSISRKYNIAIHDLIKINPELENGLKAGTTILISNKIANESQLKIEHEQTRIIDKDNKRLKSKKKKKEEEKIDSIKLNENILINDSVINDSNYIETDSLNEKLNIVYLLPIISTNKSEDKTFQRFIEFYRGSLLALNEAKQNGLSANIYTFSTGKSTDKVIEILNKIDSIDADVIIGPAYTNQLDTVISYAKRRDIVSVIPFSSKVSEEYYYPKLMQFNPPQDELYSSILENTFAPIRRKYVIGRFDNSNNKGNILANELCNLLSLNGVPYRNINVTPNNVKDIVSSFTPDSTIFMLASTSITDVASVLDSLSIYNIPNVTVWGFEEWGTNLIKKFPRTVYYSLFNPNPTHEYIELYQKWFGAYKQNSGLKYDLLGYDLTSLVMCNIIMNNNDLAFEVDSYTQYMQSNPIFKFSDNRWVNTNYYLFKWDNSTIKTIK